MPATSPPRRHSQPAAKPSPRAGLRGGDLERQFVASAASPVPNSSFEDLGLPSALVIAVSARGITAPFPIQIRTIPDALTGRDILGKAQTGSGKTLAFGLPLIARLQGRVRVPYAPNGLILVPTRELATQVTTTLAPLATSMSLRILTVYGGAPIGAQITGLRHGVDIVVATPGRLLDVIERRACSLERVRIAVLDEADFMADLGFLPVVIKLLDQTPPDSQRLLFSATLDSGVDRLIQRYLRNPAAHAVAPRETTSVSVQHQFLATTAEEKLQATLELVSHLPRSIVFVRTKHGADRLAKQLQRSGVKSAAIHGNLTQPARQRALDQFASGATTVLVATDVAARGIHVDNVDLVLHFDPPADHKDYLHRSGRTGRAGATGTVVTLLTPEQRVDAQRMYLKAGVLPQMRPPSPAHPPLGATRPQSPRPPLPKAHTWRTPQRDNTAAPR